MNEKTLRKLEKILDELHSGVCITDGKGNVFIWVIAAGQFMGSTHINI